MTGYGIPNCPNFLCDLYNYWERKCQNDVNFFNFQYSRRPRPTDQESNPIKRMVGGSREVREAESICGATTHFNIHDLQ
jgi:hypothetical protein